MCVREFLLFRKCSRNRESLLPPSHGLSPEQPVTTNHSLLLPEQKPPRDPLSPSWDTGGTVHGSWTARR